MGRANFFFFWIKIIDYGKHNRNRIESVPCFLTKISHIQGKERDNRPIVVFKVLICAQIVHLDLFLSFCKIDHFNLLCVLFQINNIDESVSVNSID